MAYPKKGLFPSKYRVSSRGLQLHLMQLEVQAFLGWRRGSTLPLRVASQPQPQTPVTTVVRGFFFVASGVGLAQEGPQQAFSGLSGELRCPRRHLQGLGVWLFSFQIFQSAVRQAERVRPEANAGERWSSHAPRQGPSTGSVLWAGGLSTAGAITHSGSPWLSGEPISFS